MVDNTKSQVCMKFGVVNHFMSKKRTDTKSNIFKLDCSDGMLILAENVFTFDPPLKELHNPNEL